MFNPQNMWAHTCLVSIRVCSTVHCVHKESQEEYITDSEQCGYTI